MKVRINLIIFSLWLIGQLQAQSTESPKIPLIHSHNDYAQILPFWNAWSNQCGSIEVDLLWYEDRLLVAHDEDNLTYAKDLRSNYLDPIRQILHDQNGRIYTDTAKRLILLLDIKNARDTILPILLQLGSEYADIFIADSGVSIVLSGERPTPDTWLALPPYIMIDSRITDIITPDQWQKVAMMSISFQHVAQWNGKGILDKSQQTNMDVIMAKARAKNVPMRFWGTPDSPSSWQMLIKNKVDWIGTDHVDQLAHFLKKYPTNFYHNKNLQSTYHPQFNQEIASVQNIILLIADGMGLAHVQAGYTANGNQLTLMKLPVTGWVNTISSDSYCTDSAAGASAYSTGHKTNNRMLAVGNDGNHLKTIIEIVAEMGKMTAVISSVNIADATPASFYAHVPERDMSEAILKDLTSSSINLIAGEGLPLFELHDWFKDSLQKKNFHIAHYEDPIPTDKSKLIRLAPWDTYLAGNDTHSRQRFGSLLDSTLSHLKQQSKKGFFLMAENGRIDSGGHSNDIATVVNEVLSLDYAAAIGARFVDQHPGTLLIVLADHETGGLSLLDGDPNNAWVLGEFSTNDHTGIAIPYWVYGAGSDTFGGFLDNTAIFHKIMAILKGHE